MVRSRAVNKIGLSCVVFFVLAAVLAKPSVATIIRGGDGSGNTTAPGDDPGWDNVGRLGGGSAVYLRNGWALTARHVWDISQPTTVSFGSSYSIQPDSWHFLHDPVDSNIKADLALFRLSGDPADPLAISGSAPPDTSEVVGIGFGTNRAASGTSWDLNWNEVTPPAPYHGFKLPGPREKRWGENHIEGTDIVGTSGTYTTECLAMDFSRFLGAGDNEMQVVQGDSGGGLFYYNDVVNRWELAGIFVARSTINDGEPPSQPSDSAVYTNKSFAADLSRYEGQIAAIIPEPTALVMLLGLGAGYLVWCIRRRAGRSAGR